MSRFCLAFAASIGLAGTAPAHFNMLLPETAMARKGDKVGFVYQFGHPFEHELFDAPQPIKVEVQLPDGKTRVDLTKKLEKFKKPGGADGKEVTAFRFDFAPEQRGDHWFVLTTPPIWMEESKEFFQDVVQVVLHVQTQNGWDKVPTNSGTRLRPLTRPYGLLPGMVFRAVFEVHTYAPVYGPLANRPVEIERYNSRRPGEIPVDELVTFQAMTDFIGSFTCTLTEPGWWCMTALFRRPEDNRMREGKDFPVTRRTSLWVHVEAKASGK